eukprot:14129484-Ditylum_brightwellii.AAC.1
MNKEEEIRDNTNHQDCSNNRLDGPMIEFLDNQDQDPTIKIVKEILSPTEEETAIAIIDTMMTFPIKIMTDIKIQNGFRIIITDPIVLLVEAMQVLVENLHQLNHKTIRMIV